VRHGCRVTPSPLHVSAKTVVLTDMQSVLDLLKRCAAIDDLRALFRFFPSNVASSVARLHLSSDCVRAELLDWNAKEVNRARE
jgi:hypothetical protein